jgi:hypothetical protein
MIRTLTVRSDAEDVKDDVEDVENDAEDVESDAKDVEDDAEDVEDDAEDVESDAEDVESDSEDLTTSIVVQTELMKIHLMNLESDSEDVESDSEDCKTSIVVQSELMKFEQLHNRIRLVNLERDVEVESDSEDRKTSIVFHSKLMKCESLLNSIRFVNLERDAEDLKSNLKNRKTRKCLSKSHSQFHFHLNSLSHHFFFHTELNEHETILSHERTVVNLRKEHEKLQIIVKLVNIHLTSKKSSYESDT